MTRFKKPYFYLIFTAVITIHQSCFAEWSFVRNLDQNLLGVQIVRVHSPKDPRDQERLNQARDLLVSAFYRNFEPIFHTFTPPIANTQKLRTYLDHIFWEDAELLKLSHANENVFFLEAIEEQTETPLGVATFLKDSDTEIYLSNFATTHFRSPENRGIGKQLLGSIFTLVPHIEKIHLLVRHQNQSAMSIYRHWGFTDDDTYSREDCKKETFLSMTLSGERLNSFRSQFRFH